MCVCVCVCVGGWVCVCVCVCERERERERETKPVKPDDTTSRVEPVFGKPTVSVAADKNQAEAIEGCFFLVIESK